MMSSTKTRRYKVTNGQVKLAVSETGQGQTLLFFNGLGATQVCWERIIRALDGQYRIVTFDFRNHGKSSTAHGLSLESFQKDAEAIMDQVAGHRPIVVGWSTGADLAVWYAAAHPGRIAGLFLIDGAVPVNLVSDPDEIRQRLDTPAVRFGPLLLYLIGMGYRLSVDDLTNLTVEINARREHVLTAYDQLDCPVEMVLATKTSGENGERAERNNQLWKTGGEQLAHLHPEISLRWLDNSHQLPFKEPTKLARFIDDFARQIQADNQPNIAH